jgi:hypothetical protein
LPPSLSFQPTRMSALTCRYFSDFCQDLAVGKVSAMCCRFANRVLIKNPTGGFADASVKFTPANNGNYTVEIYADSTNYVCPNDISSDVYTQTLQVFPVPKYDLKFTVKAQNSPTSASVTINELPETKQTDSGIATFNLARGTYYEHKVLRTAK